jgi:ethanolaminephosphotransferase
LSVCMGLLMSFLTKKMICFSMAKQSYASIQMEAFPYWAVIILIKADYSNSALFNDKIAKVLLGGLCFWYAYRLVDWANNAINQICDRLDINCFTIKEKPKKE